MKSLSSPPDIPDEPQAGPGIDDSAFVNHVSAVMEVCTKPAQINSVLLIANGAVAERGLEQMVADLADAHRIRIRDRETYLGIVQAMRTCMSMQSLAAEWVASQPAIKGLPETWRTQLAAEKDRLKAKILAEAPA